MLFCLLCLVFLCVNMPPNSFLNGWLCLLVVRLSVGIFGNVLNCEGMTQSIPENIFCRTEQLFWPYSDMIYSYWLLPTISGNTVLLLALFLIMAVWMAVVTVKWRINQSIQRLTVEKNFQLSENETGRGGSPPPK
ncbi:hypothetical protein JZ751_016795 [Albula glossodonta]|uniref:Uncharacterized protein n=1 Tax=Albula glossodonta TaxID=121402 RepID=A0A8T2NN95_9TELE|nr:hypothetical protein JZ751_016795 [Albula glossodonta]